MSDTCQDWYARWRALPGNEWLKTDLEKKLEGLHGPKRKPALASVLVLEYSERVNMIDEKQTGESDSGRCAECDTNKISTRTTPTKLGLCDKCYKDADIRKRRWLAIGQTPRHAGRQPGRQLAVAATKATRKKAKPAPAGEISFRCMRKHRLKTWPAFFDLVSRGLKPWEYRKNDRDFQVGDVLVLCEWDPHSERYSGAEHECVVGLVVTSCPGLPKGYCIMGIDGPDVEGE